MILASRIRLYKLIASGLKIIEREWNTNFMEEEIDKVRKEIILTTTKILEKDGLLKKEWWNMERKMEAIMNNMLEDKYEETLEWLNESVEEYLQSGFKILFKDTDKYGNVWCYLKKPGSNLVTVLGDFEDGIEEQITLEEAKEEIKMEWDIDVEAKD